MTETKEKTPKLQLLRDTLLYSGGDLFARLFTFFLLPLTTRCLTPQDYGLLGTLAILSLASQGLFSLGLDRAVSRSYCSTSSPRTQQRIIWTGFGTILCNGLFWGGLTYYFSNQISHVLTDTEEHNTLVFLTIATIACHAATLPLSFFLKMQRRVYIVATTMTIQIVTNISLLLLFVLSFHWGPAGVVYASLIAHALNLFLLLLLSIPSLPFGWSWKQMKEMVRVGSPAIYGSAGYVLLQCAPRYLLLQYVNEWEVGLYFMSANFARIIEIPMWGFLHAWDPLASTFIDKQKQAQKLFPRVWRLYFIALCGSSLLFFCAAQPVMKLMVAPSFFDAWKTIGVLAFAQGLWGLYKIASPPLLFVKKTGWQALLEIGAGGICILLCCLFIPLWGRGGAAIATLLSYSILLLFTSQICHKLLPITYPLKQLTPLFFLFSLLAFSTFLPLNSLLMSSGLIALHAAGFSLFVWRYGLDNKEKTEVKGWLSTLRFARIS